MRKNVQRITDAFLVGRVVGGATISTDGDVVYSYDMPIAQRYLGFIEVLPTTAGPTMTTKQHISALCSALYFAKAPYTTVQQLSGRAVHTFRRQEGRR